MLLLAQAAAQGGVLPASASYSLVWPICYVALATVLYLLIDVYLTTKTFKAIFATGAFYLLWLAYAVLALLAYGMVQVAAGDRLLVFVGHPQLAHLFQVLLAVGGALTVFQSFTVKISNFKVVDFGQFVDQYRASVYSAITDEVVRQRKRRDQVLAGHVAARYASAGDNLRDELNSLLQLAGVDGPDIVIQLESIQKHAEATDTSVVRGYATAVVRIDPQRAVDLLKN